MTWEFVTALLGVVGLTLQWLSNRGHDGYAKERLDDHEIRIRAIESAGRAGGGGQ